MLQLVPEPLDAERQQKIRAWLAEPTRFAAAQAVAAEVALAQAEHSNLVLKYPVSVLADHAEVATSRVSLIQAARLTIFLEVLDELSAPQREFKRARLVTDV